jgi:hypothetical protein
MARFLDGKLRQTTPELAAFRAQSGEGCARSIAIMHGRIPKPHPGAIALAPAST